MRAASALVVAAAAFAARLGAATECFDRNIDCSDWAEEGQCDARETRDWMREHCPAACGLCPPPRRRPRAPSRAPGRAPSRAEL